MPPLDELRERDGDPGKDSPLPFDGPQAEAETWLRAERAIEADLASENLDRNPRYRRLPGFESRFLPSPRDISIWLPVAYGLEPERRFPVLYLHDGQNLFDGRTSFVPGCTWRAHTAADRTARYGLAEPVILVGVANTGPRRMAEYTPTCDARFGGGEGRSYARLLVEELKPRIDQSFRTRTEPEHTGVAGSSLGGLISLYLGLEFPEVFGGLGVLSPSVWWDSRAILSLVGQVRPQPFPSARPRIWLDMGTAEGLRHLRDTDLLAHRLLARGWRSEQDSRGGGNFKYQRVHGGLHNEESWARRFDQVLQFLFPPLP